MRRREIDQPDKQMNSRNERIRICFYFHLYFGLFHIQTVNENAFVLLFNHIKSNLNSIKTNRFKEKCKQNWNQLCSFIREEILTIVISLTEIMDRAHCQLLSIHQ